MPERFYRPELDALRFFAFLCVFCDHVPIYWGWFAPLHYAGGFGVGLFFLLSAYLIVTLLLREQESTGTIGLKAFALRRILRIWPLYFLILFTCYFLGLHFPSAYVPARAVLYFSALLGNIYLARFGWFEHGSINPLWSISVEEQFYLIVPTLMRFGRRRALRIACLLTLCVSYATLGYLGHRGAPPIVDVWLSSFVQFQFFAMGGLLAIGLYRKQLRVPIWGRAMLFASGLVCWFIAATRLHLHTMTPSTATQLITGYLVLLAGTVALFLAALDLEATLPQPLIYLGKISYGLYLFHSLWLWFLLDTSDKWPRMQFFVHHLKPTCVLAFVATIATAAVSYQFFERPILKFKRRFESIQTRPA